MKKRFKINPKSTLQYLEIFNGMLKLTNKELEVLAAFLDKKYELKDLKVDPFSTDIKKQIAEDFGMDNTNSINTYIKALKDKQAIRSINGKYVFNPLVVKQEDEDGVVFEWTS